MSSDFIAFDRNPARVASGLASNVRVVYGDGAKRFYRSLDVERQDSNLARGEKENIVLNTALSLAAQVAGLPRRPEIIQSLRDDDDARPAPV